jgi:hypothetical protein
MVSHSALLWSVRCAVCRRLGRMCGERCCIGANSPEGAQTLA